MKMTIPIDPPINFQTPNPKSGRNNNNNTIEVTGVGSLPRDLIIVILSRLPVKTLCKFRCVSKQWLDLLSNDKSFVINHREQSKKTTLLLFRKYSSANSDDEKEEYKVNIELTSMNMNGGFINKLVCSIGGPVYTFSSCGPLVILCWAYRVCVCNPSTQQFIRLPRSPSVTQYGTVGFGHDPVSNEFKIVHLFFDNPFFGDDDEMGCEIFTLRDGEEASSATWKRVGYCPYRVRTSCSPICLNGAIYWKVADQATGLNKDPMILSFNLGKEEFRAIPYPKFYSEYDHNLLFLTVFKGSLCLVYFSTAAAIMDLWVLKEQRSKSFWVKEYNIKFSGFGAKSEIKSVVPLDNDYDGELLVDTQHAGLVYFNIQNETFRAVNNPGTVEWYKKPCLYYDGFFSLHSK